MSFVCRSYIIQMYLHVTRMSSVCHSYDSYVTVFQSYVLVCHSYVSYVSVCHSYVLVCHPYVTRMYSYVIRMSCVCGFTMIPYIYTLHGFMWGLNCNTRTFELFRHRMHTTWFYSNFYNNVILGMKLSPLAVLSPRKILNASLCQYCQKKQQENLVKKSNIEVMWRILQWQQQ